MFFLSMGDEVTSLQGAMAPEAELPIRGLDVVWCSLAPLLTGHGEELRDRGAHCT